MVNRVCVGAVSLMMATGFACGGSIPLHFSYYTGNNDPNVIPGTTFTVEVEQVVAGFADFTFAIPSAVDGGFGIITQIYFEMNITGLGSASIYDSSLGVNMVFDEDPSPPPGAGGIGWDESQTEVFRISGPGGVNNGINAGEFLTLRFVDTGDFFTTGLFELLSGMPRIAFHLQQIGENGDGSAHFITTLIPLPTAGMMAGLAICGLAVRRRRA